MTVCRTAVESFFSVSWGSGLSDHTQGGGLDVFLGCSFPAFSSRAASGAIEQRPARKLGAQCPSSFIARRNLVSEALVLASQAIPGRADFLALRPSHAAVAEKLKLARSRRPASGLPPQTSRPSRTSRWSFPFPNFDDNAPRAEQTESACLDATLRRSPPIRAASPSLRHSH
jgi:hypothetical protein